MTSGSKGEQFARFHLGEPQRTQDNLNADAIKPQGVGNSRTTLAGDERDATHGSGIDRRRQSRCG